MNLSENFRHFLRAKNLTDTTVKNYVSDVNHFLTWLHQKTGINPVVARQKIFGLFTKEALEEYKTDLKSVHTPLATINRRLSALRKFGQFGQTQGWLGPNAAARVANTRTKVNFLKTFQAYLEKEKVSPVTIKNYLSDIRQFLAWVQAN